MIPFEGKTKNRCTEKGNLTNCVHKLIKKIDAYNNIYISKQMNTHDYTITGLLKDTETGVLK